METVKCHICGYSASESPEKQSLFCAICGADLTDQKTETKLMEAPLSATYATSDSVTDLRVEASLYLTNKRLVVVPAKLQGFGPSEGLEAVVYDKITSKSGVISIQFENVKAVRDGKFGLFLKALIIDTTDNKMLKLTAPKQKEWKAAIIKAANNL